MFGRLGKLERLKILSFRGRDFNGPSLGVFIANVNPESYQISSSITYEPQKGTEVSNDQNKIVKVETRTLSFNIILDSTGLIGPIGNIIPVPTQLENFRRVTELVDPELHRPPYLIVNWGTLVFKCVLQNTTVNYTLFSPLGVPLRAILNVSFKEDSSLTVKGLLMDLRSPDLTKEITVKEGDTLPLLCHQVYEDSSMYLKVAQVNKMKNFRRLTPGQKLIFPPIVNNGVTTR